MAAAFSQVDKEMITAILRLTPKAAAGGCAQALALPQATGPQPPLFRAHHSIAAPLLSLRGGVRFLPTAGPHG